MFTISKIKPRPTFKLKGKRATYIERFQYASDIERTYLIDQLKALQNARTSAYEFKDNSTKESVGVLFVTIDKINLKPCLIVDYLFVNSSFRGAIYPELDILLSEMMMAFVGDLAKKINKHVSLDLIALQLVTNKLIPTYKGMGFSTLKRGKDNSWMGMSVK